MKLKPWVAAVAGFVLGVVVGGAGVYAGLRLAAGRSPADDPPPAPAEADGRARLQALLTAAGLDAEVVTFRQTDRRDSVIRWDGVDRDGKLTPVAVPYHMYGLAYEAEILFHRDGGVRENFTLMWSPGNTADGKTPTLSHVEEADFRGGERKMVRGLLFWKLTGRDWQPDPKDHISGTRTGGPS